MNKPLVAIYCRLSDEDRDKKISGEESESIQNQRSMLLEYSMKMNWDVYQIYCDEDYSGADQSRPEWLRMLHACENGKIDIVLCKTQSRFSREIEITEKYLSNKFPKWGVRFVAPYDNIDTENIEGKKARQIGGLVNEWYLDELSANIKKTLEHKKRKGQWTGSFAPYGYMIDPNDHNKLLIDQTAAYIVKEIFQLYLSGHGYQAIAKILNDRKVPNPSVYKRNCGLKFRTNSIRPTSNIWTESTIYRVLRNETYTGTMVQGKRRKISYKHPSENVPQDEWIRVPNTHEPIIDIETWDAIKNKLAGNRSRQQKTSGKKHVLSGKIFCEECGNSMWKMRSKHAYGTYQYYKCRSTKGNYSVCTNNRAVRVDHLDSLITDAVNTLLSEYYEPSAISVSSPKKDNTNIISILEKEKNKNTIDIQRKRSATALIYEDVSEGRLSRSESANIISKYTEEIKQREERNTAIDLEIKSIVPAFEPVLEDVILRFGHISEISTEIVDELIDKVTIGQDMKDSREVTIFWNF